jgi:hypothetical protein
MKLRHRVHRRGGAAHVPPAAAATSGGCYTTGSGAGSLS